MIPRCRTFTRPALSLFKNRRQNLLFQRRLFSIEENSAQLEYLLRPPLVTKAQILRDEYHNLSGELSDSYDAAKAQKLSRLETLVGLLDKYTRSVSDLEELNSLINSTDPDTLELRDEAYVDAEDIKAQLTSLTLAIKRFMIAPHPFANLPCILEFRPGVGGAEAMIFAKNLMDMYVSYCHQKHWRYSIVGVSPIAVVGGQGISEGFLAIEEPGSYGRLRLEGGVHRVQRVPETEAKGRIHTSAAAIIVLPQLDDGNSQSPDAERSFAPGEVRVDVMRARGAGGQHVNTTDSAVRLTHIPTGTVVAIQDNRSQHKNKAKAFMILRARLAEQEHEARMLKESEARKSQVNSTDRSDKIRTYNYSQNRVTDHRCGFTMYDLDGCMKGVSLELMLDKVHEWAETEEMKDL